MCVKAYACEVTGGPVGEQESSQYERKSGIGAVTLSAAGKREGEKEGRLDSIKPKPAGKLFGILHFYQPTSSVDFFLYLPV